MCRLIGVGRVREQQDISSDRGKGTDVLFCTTMHLLHIDALQQMGDGGRLQRAQICRHLCNLATGITLSIYSFIKYEKLGPLNNSELAV